MDATIPSSLTTISPSIEMHTAESIHWSILSVALRISERSTLMIQCFQCLIVAWFPVNAFNSILHVCLTCICKCNWYQLELGEKKKSLHHDSLSNDSWSLLRILLSILSFVFNCRCTLCLMLRLQCAVSPTGPLVTNALWKHNLSFGMQWGYILKIWNSFTKGCFQFQRLTCTS